MRGGVIASPPDDVHYVALHARLYPHISYLGAAARDRVCFSELLDFNLIQATRIKAFIPPRDHLTLFIG